MIFHSQRVSQQANTALPHMIIRAGRQRAGFASLQDQKLYKATIKKWDSGSSGGQGGLRRSRLLHVTDQWSQCRPRAEARTAQAVLYLVQKLMLFTCESLAYGVRTQGLISCTICSSSRLGSRAAASPTATATKSTRAILQRAMFLYSIASARRRQSFVSCRSWHLHFRGKRHMSQHWMGTH